MHRFLVAGDPRFQGIAQQALELVGAPYETIYVESESSLRLKFEWLANNPKTVVIVDPILRWQTESEKRNRHETNPHNPPYLLGGLRFVREMKADIRTWGTAVVLLSLCRKDVLGLDEDPISNIHFLERGISPDPVPLADLLKRLLKLP